MNEDDSFGEDDDEMDDLLVSALEDTTGILRSVWNDSRGGGSRGSGENNVDLGTDLVDGFDVDAGRTWIYPTNKQVRDYQYNIVRTALVKNTLVCLPTGLGKTFISAVLMYNFYRWFPRGKILFLAPTKPLVAQQIEACFDVMGIPQSDMSEMTGSMNPKSRTIAWEEKRVFFLTPQVISNDISRGICPARAIKCVVVDEAHKAMGNHAYVQVVRELHDHGGQFRVLALSATPGSDFKQVQQVITNLLISDLEVRTEDSADIVPYVHERTVVKIVVDLGDELTEMKTQFLQIVDVYVGRLQRNNVLAIRKLESLTKFMLLMERDRFRQNPPDNLARSRIGIVECDFAIAISLYHALDLLQFYGMRSFYVYWNEMLNGDKGMARTRYELQRNVTFCRIIDNLERRFKRKPDPSGASASSYFCSHPKFEKLEEIVLEHFKETEDTMINETRIIIFAQYRESVREIETVLNRHRPTVRPAVLLGQGMVGGSAKGLKQKLQLKVMDSFRLGECNVLVSTCVGEEGLDIGDVDLIVCFDAQNSPVRLVQRMGRTGRKRDGRVVVLLTKGREENIHNRGQYNTRAINKALSASYEMFPANPRMIPKEIEPVCHKMFLSASVFVHEEKAVVGSVDRVTRRKQRKTVSPYLSDTQLNEWKSRYYITRDETLKFAFGPQMVSLKPLTESSKTPLRPRQGSILSLTEWLPWQNTLNPSFCVDHTELTKMFVDTMKQLELSSCGMESDGGGATSSMPICAKKASESNTDVVLTDHGHQTKKRRCGDLNVGSRQKAEVWSSCEELNRDVCVEMASRIAGEENDLQNGHVVAQADPSRSSFFGSFLQFDDDFLPNDTSSRFSKLVSIRTPPTSPTISAASLIDWLDTMEVMESDFMFASPVPPSESIICPSGESNVCCDVTESSLLFADPFKTPRLPIGTGRKAINRDTPLPSIPSTAKSSLGIYKSPDVSVKPLEESLYSMSQLLGLIDYSLAPTPAKRSPVAPTTPSATVSTNELLTNVDKLCWDSDDDLFANCDIIPPTPPKPEDATVACHKNFFFRQSEEFAGECSTSTPLAIRSLVPTSPLSEDDTTSPIGRVRMRRKRPCRLHLSTSDSGSDSKAEKRNFNSCSGIGKMFLLDEAEVSGESAVSTDETFSEDSEYEQSFINDKQHTQNETNTAMYLQSVKGLRSKPGAFKLVGCGADFVSDCDVYSQSQISQDSDYLRDSFCVDNDSREMTTLKRRRVVANRDQSSGDEAMILSPDFDDVHLGGLDASTPLTKDPIVTSPTPYPPPAASMKESSAVSAVCSNISGTNFTGKVVVLVDSREMAGSQVIISKLRLKHNAEIVVARLGNCDYIVSKRLAVERKLLSDVANGALHKKLLNRIQDMSEAYMRTCLIIERDNTKPNEQPRVPRMSQRLAGILVRLCAVFSRIVFTKSQEHTAELLFDLANNEARRGHVIEKKHLENENAPAFAFYLKILENNYVAAANLSMAYPSLGNFFKSSPEEISLRGFVPIAKAERIHQIVRQGFN